MKSLSQSDYGLIRSLYQDVYAPDIAESILDEFTDEDLDDLTDEYIEEQVIEFFEECLEEGLDIDIVEQTICESVDTELEILTEVTNPAQVAAMRMRDKTSAASGEGIIKLLTGTGNDQNYMIVPVSADRGLCGGFNSSINREAFKLVKSLENDGKNVQLMPVGKKSRDFFNRVMKDQIVESFIDLNIE